MEAIDDLYRMDFNLAEADTRKAMALNPEHPHPYLSLAGITWTRYVYGRDQSDQTLLPVFESQVNRAMEVSRRWLQKHPGDPEGLMTLGAAYGVSSRLLLVRRQWLKAYRHARMALQFTRSAVKADPKLHDAYLCIGMYDYYADLYPRLIGALARLVLGGSRLRGIATLKMVAEEGRYSRNAAKMMLVEIYTEDPYGARNPAEAVRIMREFRARYPRSAMLHSAMLVALYSDERYEDVVHGAGEFLGLVAEGKYESHDKAEGEVILATALWALGRREQALEAFGQAAQVRIGDALSRWATWALLRRGELEDSMGNRWAALKDYSAAASRIDSWGLRERAVKRALKPFREEFPGPIPPP